MCGVQFNFSPVYAPLFVLLEHVNIYVFISRAFGVSERDICAGGGDSGICGSGEGPAIPVSALSVRPRPNWGQRRFQLFCLWLGVILGTQAFYNIYAYDIMYVMNSLGTEYGCNTGLC